MRLIDADKLIAALMRDYYGSGKKTIGQIIDEQPTIYHRDDFIDQLYVEAEEGYVAPDDAITKGEYDGKE